MEITNLRKAELCCFNLGLLLLVQWHGSQKLAALQATFETAKKHQPQSALNTLSKPLDLCGMQKYAEIKQHSLQ